MTGKGGIFNRKEFSLHNVILILIFITGTATSGGVTYATAKSEIESLRHEVREAHGRKEAQDNRIARMEDILLMLEKRHGEIDIHLQYIKEALDEIKKGKK